MKDYTADGVTVVEMDEGKANALGFASIDGLARVLDAAERGGTPLVVTGRTGMLCAGYDLEVMRSGDPEQVAALLDAGRSLFLRILSSPVPVVVACGGHAIAAGALLLLVGDLRCALDGEYQIGFNEVRIGLALPEFGVAVASDRLAAPSLTRAVAFGELTNPRAAREFGFVDHVVDDDVLGAAIDAARALAALPAEAVATTKRRRNEALLATLRSLADR